MVSGCIARRQIVSFGFQLRSLTRTSSFDHRATLTMSLPCFGGGEQCGFSHTFSSCVFESGVGYESLRAVVFLSIPPKGTGSVGGPAPGQGC